MSSNLVVRFRKWLIFGIAFGAFFYFLWALWAGLGGVGGRLQEFELVWLIPLVVLTLANYGLRFVKWRYYLHLLDVKMPLNEDIYNYMAGMAMTITPGKAGELLKPYVVRERTGTPMATTVPALVSERLTDVIAMLILTAVGVTQYASEHIGTLIIMSVIILAGLAGISVERFSMGVLDLLAKAPMIGRFVPGLRSMYVSARVCLAPGPLLLTVGISLVAWYAECVAFWLTFRGFGQWVSVHASTFIYAAFTILGAALPAGLGVTDGGLAGGATVWLGVDDQTAIAAAFIARAVTLWMGIGLGALALLKVSALLGRPIDLDQSASDPEG